MRFSISVIIGGLLSIASAERTVTKTIYVTGPPPTGSNPTPVAHNVQHGAVVTPPTGPHSSHWTNDGTVTSVRVNIKHDSTYLPSPGTYTDPYRPNHSISMNAAEWSSKRGWTTLSKSYQTVYAFTAGGAATHTGVEAIYQGVHFISVHIVVIVEVSPDTYSVKSTVSGTPVFTPHYQTTYPASDQTGDERPAAATHTVQLRADNGVVRFVPDHINGAEVDDVVNFVFLVREHSATQSTFETPCTPLDEGFDSGLVSNTGNITSPEFTQSFTVASVEKPLWFYCKQKQANHCGQGMVFGINPGNLMGQFINNAKVQNGALVTLPPPAATPTTAATSTCCSATATQTVTVSGGLANGVNTLQFSPPFLRHAKKNTHIKFDFRRLNHTLTESTLHNPCKAKAEGFDSGFNFFNENDVPGSKLLDFLVNTEDDVPRWFYCRQANGTPNGHCSNGMVFAFNVNEEEFEEFQRNANATLEDVPAARSKRGYARFYEA
ncbi:hypothetical protein M501DRAFT_985799 [Patellaria atrata CBS 101060]|uniref:Cupredoxin n=1 Tax=Patellaria atrata CBS 101060 TaxID=1346257 RepID=A0A9P4VW42_9PEZI|nr:hypothetical protein M501DRAFT_985799 [Patellaria atrata CBS 101060]